MGEIIICLDLEKTMAVIREIRDIDSDRIVIELPEAFRKKRVEILVFPLEGGEKEDACAETVEEEKLNASGLCGLWEDERSPDEIIDDIHSHRTGFGNRKLTL
jgi:hypothetical protein